MAEHANRTAQTPSLFLNMALNLAAIFTVRPLWIDGCAQVLSVKSARTSMDCKHAIQRAPTFFEPRRRERAYFRMIRQYLKSLL